MEIKYKIIGFMHTCNELRKENLQRFMKYIFNHVDELVVYDHGSTDGTYELLKKYTNHIIRNSKNDSENESKCNQQLLELTLSLNPDFILWMNPDEILSNNTNIQNLCINMKKNNTDGLLLHKINIWRSKTYKRIDNQYDLEWLVKLWKVKPGMRFESDDNNFKRYYPITINNISKNFESYVINYGFSNDLNLSFKFFINRRNGVRGDELNKIILEKGGSNIDLTTYRVDRNLFPQELWDENDRQPEQHSFEDNFNKISKYKDLVFKPNITYVCLIYKSIKWLKFFYEQFLKYTDMKNNEFYFIANDAVDEVKEYLTCNRIPHYIYNNNESQRKEFYINNVYRAYNYSAKVARGDYLVFLNSDMCFSKNWAENLFGGLNGSNCVCSRLVESGKMTSGLYGIGRNFGYICEEYNEQGFNNYADSISENVIKDSGLYMPLLIRKDDFIKVNGYPEGNISQNCDMWNPIITQKGEPCRTGDFILMQKLSQIGIKHQTVFNSIVYHFQAGELMDNIISNDILKNTNMFIICNDYITGRNGEKVLWQYLVELSSNNYGVDMDNVKPIHRGTFEQQASEYILKNHLNTGIVLQNASFMSNITTNAFKISYLQDNFRKMGYDLNQQEVNLRNSNYVITNSVSTAASYPEIDCEVIPIGVDEDVFKPMDKLEMKKKYGFDKYNRIGIFVGEFSGVKGWPTIETLINNHQDIFWIIVSKNVNDKYNTLYSITYNKISHSMLSELLNCADFFIVGSNVETLCLAAIEACLCNVPVIMHDTGVFYEFTEEEKQTVGIITDNFENALNEIFKRNFTPRDTIIRKNLTSKTVMEKWKQSLQCIQLKIDSRQFYI